VRVKRGLEGKAVENLVESAAFRVKWYWSVGLELGWRARFPARMLLRFPWRARRAPARSSPSAGVSSIAASRWSSASTSPRRRAQDGASKGAAAETREAFDTIFALLRHIDEGNDDVVFVADEGGSWQVGVDWGKVVPAWFRCLSKSAEPSEFASVVVTTIVDLDSAEDEEEWERRVMALAAVRITAERARLEGLGVIDAKGELVSHELPPDMLPESDTTLETG